jgi:hypothetical protein
MGARNSRANEAAATNGDGRTAGRAKDQLTAFSRGTCHRSDIAVMMGVVMRRFAVIATVTLLAACASTPPKATGLGATAAAWHAHHGAAYSNVLTNEDGRVSGYSMTMSPRSLVDAEALVRRDLPVDATAGAPVLTVGDEATKCEIVEFTAPSLAGPLGNDRVMAVFSTSAAVTMDTNAIDHAVVVSGAEHYPRAC